MDTTERAWVLMAWEGHRDYAECWHPAAVFIGAEPPTDMQRARALIRAARHPHGLPWDSHRGGDDMMRPLSAGDLTSLVEIPAELVHTGALSALIG